MGQRLANRSALSLLAGLGLFTSCCAVRAAEPQRPNIILILIDDMGAHDLGCYGSKFYRTPNIDRLAERGMKFTDAYTACSVCSPTRASILTGRYPPRYNLTDFLPGRSDRPDQKLLRPVINQHLPLEETTLAEALKSAGYTTGHLGKWHLGGEGFGPKQRGFDVSIGGDQSGSPASWFAPFANSKGKFMPGLEQAPKEEYLTDRLTAEAEKFIEQNRARPFFLYLAHYTVHIPLKAKAQMIAHYHSNGKPGEQNNTVYAAMIESLDDGVGRLIQKLKSLGLSERTVLIFTSDNGGLSVFEGPDTPATINTPLREGKGYLYEGGIRVPLIVTWPGVTHAGRVCSVPVCSIDYYPTIAEMCGLKNTPAVDGVSLVPVLKGSDELPRACALLALSALQQPGWQAWRSDPRRQLQTHRILRTGQARAVRLEKRRGRNPQSHRGAASAGKGTGWQAGKLATRGRRENDATEPGLRSQSTGGGRQRDFAGAHGGYPRRATTL